MGATYCFSKNLFVASIAALGKQLGTPARGSQEILENSKPTVFSRSDVTVYNNFNSQIIYEKFENFQHLY
jgi:hypothetical protein